MNTLGHNTPERVTLLGTVSLILRMIEVSILFCGAFLGALLALSFIFYLGWGWLQSPSQGLGLSQSIMRLIITFIVFLVPAGGAFVCTKALLEDKARWPALAAIPAGLIGGSTMLLMYSVAWHYHPNTDKMPGILGSLATGVLAMSPFIVIAISRAGRKS